MIKTEIHNPIEAGGYPFESKTLFEKPTIAFGIVITYVLIVKWIIPWSLKDRKPFDLRKIVIAYNFFLTLQNGYFTYLGFSCIGEHWSNRCSAQTGPRDLWNQYSSRAAQLFHYGLMLKYVELLDTVLFALRKKQRNITFLHVFHHVSVIFLGTWACSQFNFAFFYLFSGTINCAVHVVMYLYYGLAAVGASMQKYLWWKKYLTLIQMGQFVIIFLYGVNGIFTGCETAAGAETSLTIFAAILLFLFANFYVKAYNQTKLNSKKIK